MLQNIKSRIKNFFNQFFCKHHYSFVGTIPFSYYYNDAKTEKHDCSVDFFECEYCRKRKVLSDIENVYNGVAWKELKMWENHELEIDFTDYKEKVRDK